MRKAAADYVFQRGNGAFYLRRTVPSDLVVAVGKSEWKVSLKTKDAGTVWRKRKWKQFDEANAVMNFVQISTRKIHA